MVKLKTDVVALAKETDTAEPSLPSTLACSYAYNNYCA